MSGCGAVVGGVSLENVDITTQAVIQGVITSGDAPASVGYARLHDRNDEFVAEVPISKQGEFRFFTVAGDWTIVALIPGASSRTQVQATLGNVLDVDISLSK
jgi:hypothetical protein